MKNYPAWKKVVWRYARVFVAASVAQVGANLALATEPDYQKTVVVSAVAAGLSAVAKALREGRSVDSKVQKLPV